MARLEMAVEHGQAPEAAREDFEEAVAAARSQYGRWIHRAEWSADRTAVSAAGAADQGVRGAGLEVGAVGLAEVYNKKSVAASRNDFIHWKIG